MKVTLISTYCSKDTYEKLFSIEKRNTQQYQKYMRLIATGLVNNGVSVSCISVPPINRFNYQSKLLRLNGDSEYGIGFSYVKLINIPILRNISAFFGTFLKVIKSHDATVYIQDLLNVTTTLATYFATRLSNKKILGILTDMPNAYIDYESRSVPIQKRITQFLCEKCAYYYLFLTEEMNDVVNRNNKPYTIIEGFADYEVRKRINNLDMKMNPRVCMYAGGINKLYGLDMLVNGFIKAAIPECELHIYGDGPYVEELKEICAHNENIKYLGILNNSDIISMEEKATLLVNPRYTTSEFVKYSFPSKNIEYMSSGTPILTTKLPGMPSEYYDYVYLLEDETEDSMAAALTTIMKQKSEVIHSFGGRAKRWILNNKNNIKLTKKIINLINEKENQQ